MRCTPLYSHTQTHCCSTCIERERDTSHLSSDTKRECHSVEADLWVHNNMRRALRPCDLIDTKQYSHKIWRVRSKFEILCNVINNVNVFTWHWYRRRQSPAAKMNTWAFPLSPWTSACHVITAATANPSRQRDWLHIYSPRYICSLWRMIQCVLGLASRPQHSHRNRKRSSRLEHEQRLAFIFTIPNSSISSKLHWRQLL